MQDIVLKKYKIIDNHLKISDKNFNKKNLDRNV